MESILVSMVLLVLMIVGNVTMTMNSIQSTAKVSASWKATEEQASTIMRTNIAIVPPENYYGGTLDLTVKNAGQVSISDFAKWDVIIQEQGASTEYMDNSASYPAGTNQWALQGIYASDNVPAVFDPNILDPGEEAVIGINPGAVITAGEMIKITLSTSNGVTAQCYVTAQTAPSS